MTRYDYYEEVKNDVINYINENMEYIKEKVDISDRDQLESWLSDELFVDDSITGNASGSYTFNRAEAKEYVLDNIDLLSDACDNFGENMEKLGYMFLAEDWETFDVFIRLYVLDTCISDAIDEIDLPEDEEN